MVPTLRPTLGGKGDRPGVGQLDGHAGLDVCGALHVVTGRLTTRLVERPRTPTRSPQRSVQEAFAHHGRAIARTYPAAPYPRAVIVIDTASWHRGAFSTAVLAAFPHLELSPLPSYSPKRQGIERFWKVLRRRAPHHRLFPTRAQLKQTLRNHRCYYQTLKHRVLSVMQSSRKRSKSSAA
jgi:DDE superfamily endonuclease